MDLLAASEAPEPRPERWSQAISVRSEAAFLVAMMVLASALRVPRLWIHYWSDEAISLGISTHSFLQIPRYLRYDGSPPLYYFVLHVWIRLFGTSEVATHSLSLLLSLALIPLLWWSARSLLGRRAARPAAVLGAVFPYLNYYGTEARMYVLAGVFALVAFTGFVLAVQAPEEKSVRRQLLFAVLGTVGLLYTHNWGIFFTAGLGVTGLAAAYFSDSRTRLWRTLIYGAGVGVCYAPWVPSLFWQARYTGAPWAEHPNIGLLVGDPAWIAFGMAIPFAVFGMAAAGYGIWKAVKAGAPIEVRTNDTSGLDDHPGRHGWLVGWPLSYGWLIAFVIDLIAWVTGQVINLWDGRYLVIIIVPAIVLLAGMFVATDLGRRALPWVVGGMILSALPNVVYPPLAADTKSNVYTVDKALGSSLHPGDLVVTPDVSDVPVIAHYLPPGLRYATPLGVLADPGVVNWQQLPTRLYNADPTANLANVLRSVPVGGKMLLINPTNYSIGKKQVSYPSSLRADEIAANVDIFQAANFTQERAVKTGSSMVGNAINGWTDSSSPVEGILFRKTS